MSNVRAPFASLAIGLAFCKLVALDATMHAEEESRWDSDHAEMDGERREYRSVPSFSGKRHLNRVIESKYQRGATIAIRVNPTNANEVAFPENALRIRWIGYLGAGFFGVIGVSVLFNRSSHQTNQSMTNERGS